MRFAKTFLTKTDRLEGLADRDPASRYELPRRLEVIGFGTPPLPEVFAAHWSDTALTDL
jgi:hypothetical protein